jgi:hypothetical protein
MVGARTVTECLSILSARKVESQTGYHCVYRHKTVSAKPFIFRGFQRRVSPMFDTPRNAAIYGARWFQYWFGDDWPEFFYGRVLRPVVYTCPNKTWRVHVWIMGVEKNITPRRTILGSLEQAKQHFQNWHRNRYGIFEPLSYLELRRRAARPPRQAITTAYEGLSWL